ncbi:hypothetical protein [Marinobacter sp. M5B]|uniref:hypothetical protein n=1 Tax=Marinobacter sp. M5B TaxID=3141535 RepID=UPI0036D3F209
MRVGILLAVLWCLSFQANAAPIWTYDLKGTVAGSEEAAGYLADVDVGDAFSIRMSMQKQLDTSYKIKFTGVIGGWSFSEQETSAYYIFGDLAPERFYTHSSSSPIEAPVGTSGPVDPWDIYLLLLGPGTLDTHEIAEEDRMIKSNGWLDTNKFREGRLSFHFFTQLSPDGNSWVEDDLVGDITSVTEVSEPVPATLLAIGLLGIWCRCRRMQGLWTIEIPS